MAGFALFQEQVTLFNRAPVALNVRFDGQDMTLPPGEIPGFPKMAMLFALNQNPIMGSEDPFDPTSWKSLIAIKGHRKFGNCTPLTAAEWDKHCGSAQRIDRTELDENIKQDDPKAKVVLRGRKKPSAFDATTGTRQNEDGGGFASSVNS